MLELRIVAIVTSSATSRASLAYRLCNLTFMASETLFRNVVTTYTHLFFAYTCMQKLFIHPKPFVSTSFGGVQLPVFKVNKQFSAFYELKNGRNRHLYVTKGSLVPNICGAQYLYTRCRWRGDVSTTSYFERTVLQEISV